MRLSINGSNGLASNRNSHRRKAGQVLAAALGTVIAGSLVQPLFATTANTVWTDAAGDQLWSTAGNWSGGIAPNNNTGGISDFNVSIGTPAPVNLNFSPTMDSLTLSAGGQLNIQSGSQLLLDGPGLSDAGAIVVDSNSAVSPTALTFAANSSLTGSGTIYLDNSTSAYLNSSIGVTITQASTHSIAGDGIISLNLINNGTVNAYVGGESITLTSSDETNNGLMEATGGSLDVNGITLNQSATGQLSAAGGNVYLTNGAIVSGGMIQTSGNNSVVVSGNATVNNVKITTGSSLFVPGQSTANVSGGTLENDGTITVDDNGGSTAALNFTTSTLLTGNGSVYLYDYSPRAMITASSNAVITVDSNQLIHGTGDIDAAITNNGTIDADFAGQSIAMQTGNIVNNNLMEATNNASLSIAGVTLTFGSHGTTSGVLCANGGNVYLGDGTTIVGGNFQSSGSSTINITSNSKVNVSGGTLTNNAAIVIDDNGGNPAALNFTTSTLLTGNGSIYLYDYQPRAMITASPNAVLTIGANQFVHGTGDVDAVIINNGTIDADFAGQTIVLNGDVTNNGLLEATGNGNLVINGVQVTTGSGATTPVIAALGGNVYLEPGTTITNGNFQSSQGSAFNIASNATVNISGGSLVNNATINIDDFGGNPAALNFTSSTQVDGTGSIYLFDYRPRAMITASANAVVTIGANQLVHGTGDIDAAVTNNGIINADFGGQTIAINSNITNNNLMEATSGGILVINGTTLNQSTGGTVFANGGPVYLNSGTVINGGTVQTAAGSNLMVPSNATVTLQNTGVLNNGTITVDDNGNNTANLIFSTNTTVSGQGSIYIFDYNPRAVLSTTSGAVLTIDPNQTIHGTGDLDAALINNGTINADFGGQSLVLQTFNVSNNDLIEATGSGNLVINGITVTQGSFNGTSGVINASSGFVTLSNNAAVVGGTINFAGSYGIIAGGGPATLTNVNISAGIAITVGNNASLALDIDRHSVLVLSTLTIAGSYQYWEGQLDIGKNELDITQGNLRTVTNQLAAGFNGGNFQGAVGITSSAIASDTTHLLTLGVIQNNQSGTALFNSSNLFEGTIPGAGDILIKTTYFGDTNLDGKVDGSDYSRIDAAFVADSTNPGTYLGWFNGDFNYDGVINGSDYTLIDNAFNTQGSQIDDAIAMPTDQLATSAVPEPDMALIAVSGSALLRRRRRSSITIDN